MTEQATKDRHRLLAGNLVAGVTVSVDGLAGARELGDRRACHRIEIIDGVEGYAEPVSASPAARS